MRVILESGAIIVRYTIIIYIGAHSSQQRRLQRRLQREVLVIPILCTKR